MSKSNGNAPGYKRIPESSGKDGKIRKKEGGKKENTEQASRVEHYSKFQSCAIVADYMNHRLIESAAHMNRSSDSRMAFLCRNFVIHLVDWRIMNC